MFDTYFGLRSTRVTSTASPQRRKYLDTVAPPMPPPITITRAFGLVGAGSAHAERASIARPEDATQVKKRRRSMSMSSLLCGQPLRKLTQLSVGEPHRMPGHDVLALTPRLEL